VKPVYETLPAWQGDISGARTLADLPASVRAYVTRIEAEVGCRIELLSVGADREQTLAHTNPFAL
jgi:adenylosuccinate synthase